MMKAQGKKHPRWWDKRVARGWPHYPKILFYVALGGLVLWACINRATAEIAELDWADFALPTSMVTVGDALGIALMLVIGALSIFLIISMLSYMRLKPLIKVDGSTLYCHFPRRFPLPRSGKSGQWIVVTQQEIDLSAMKAAHLSDRPVFESTISRERGVILEPLYLGLDETEPRAYFISTDFIFVGHGELADFLNYRIAKAKGENPPPPEFL